MMVHQPFSSSYSSFSPFFPLQIKSKSFQMFNTPPSYLYLKNQLTFPLIIHHYPSPSCSLRHLSTKNTSHSTSFAFSYLINTFNFSPELASKLCSTYNIRFQTSRNPDLVLNFFRNNGFSETQLRNIIPKAIWLLSCNPSIRVIPKFQFFLSKGASKSDIVKLVNKCPRILSPSLENHIVPAYELLYRFMQSDQDTIDLLIHKPYLLSSHHVPYNIKLLVHIGVRDSTIVRLLKGKYTWIFQVRKMPKMVEELKNSGFHPSKTTFVIALLARENQPAWREKVDLYKNWGWSDEDVEEAYKKYPYFMLVSINKINSVMNFWVNQFGWDARAIAKAPHILSLSLEKRITPRAHVVQFLLESGLQKENASFSYPFLASEKRFRDSYLKGFKDESYLLKLYEEKLNLAYTTDKNSLQ